MKDKGFETLPLNDHKRILYSKPSRLSYVMNGIVNKSARFRKVCQLLLSLIIAYD